MKSVVGIAVALAACASVHAESTWKDIVGDGPKVERIATNFVFTEGPVWSPKGYLLFSDVPAGIIYKWTAKEGATTFRNPSGHSNGLTFDRQARLIACESEGRVSRTEKDGTRTVIAARYQGKNLNSPNDVVVKSDGSIYFTDPTYGLTPPNVPVERKAELDFRGIYRIAPDGKLTLLGREFGQPNGLAFSPGEKRLYVDDSDRNNIRVFDVMADGTLTNDRVFATPREAGKEGATDGMKVDVKGNVYCTGPGAVWVYAQSGTLLGKITTPEVPANCAFGDKDRKTLYITARHSVYKVRLRIRGM